MKEWLHFQYFQSSVLFNNYSNSIISENSENEINNRWYSSDTV
jgi:hypothetical protein